MDHDLVTLMIIKGLVKIQKKHEKMIKFIYTNIRSIKTKFDEFKTLVNTENPDIIGLTETWLNCNKNEFESEFNLEGYTMLNKDRKNKKGGGVLFYIKDYLKPTCLDLQGNNDKTETIWAHLRGANNKRINVGVIYRPPDQKADVDDIMYNEINEVVSRNQNAVIMGDFNLPNIN